MITDHKSGFGLVTILLHWVSAFLIVFLFGLGLYMVGLGYYDPWYNRAPSLHISLGLVVLLLTLIRIVWRLIFFRRPAPLPEHSRSVRLLSATVQYSLYGLILVVLVSGYLITTADGRSASLFGLIDFPSVMRLGVTGVDRAGFLHYWMAWAIIVLAALHTLAALAHHFVLRDRTLVRMLDPRSKR
ncbi:cytochrome b [Marinimicrobium sp. ABcell2]|uniref:cytochrome b n=1 Tax=Marinimicrobium sp. ABcell2 TaxID=3069751 RepID=UPI0027B20C6D|nr:cytochrome b [Marinimicrobium sp. ABcell2]MDQ2076953.1 cytochrome b [Marinimicrobium sp. ABcell2]